MASTSTRSIRILLVEDSPTDILLTREALLQAKVHNELNVVQDGASAIDFLKRQGPYEAASRPDVILLDLNLPKKDGREVLSEIKNDPDLMTIPVVVLTTSRAEEDVLKSYMHHANCYITKPLDFSKFQELVLGIERFWFSIVTLPPDR